ncbi:MAG: hypothetical protein HYS22_06790 [Deltaproteobacteria bacterium]|nr:hypothetical protein [Deltaproteobacteria bacterium]
MKKCLLFFSFLFLSSSFAQESRPTSGAKAFLPDISLIGSFAGAYFKEDPTGDQGENPSRTGFNLQGMELALQSVIDPYVRGDIFILFKEDAVEVEEATVTTLALPWNLQLRAGKLLAKFGRENTRHLEQLNFVDQSFTNRYFFGTEGFRELGAEISLLFPAPWFSELTFEFLQGENKGNFDGLRKRDFAYLGHWTNGFDLTDDLALQSGFSAAFGFNDTAQGKLTQIYGADLYLRWKPSNQSGLKWQTEYFLRRRNEVPQVTVEGGLYSSLVLRFARRWESGVRFDFIGLPKEDFRRRAYATDLTFLASEFFRLRAQYNLVVTGGTDKLGHEAFLQLQFNMGPHGAHAF